MKLFFAAVVAIFVLQGCVSFQEIEFKKFNGYNVERTNGDKTALKIKTVLLNPNSFNVKIKKAKLNLVISGSDAGTITLAWPVVIEKNKELEYEVTLLADKSKITKAITEAGIGIALSGKVMVNVKGWVKGKALGIGKKIKIDEKKTLSLKDLGLTQEQE